jgi:hypothetical protein
VDEVPLALEEDEMEPVEFPPSTPLVALAVLPGEEGSVVVLSGAGIVKVDGPMTTTTDFSTVSVAYSVEMVEGVPTAGEIDVVEAVPPVVLPGVPLTVPMPLPYPWGVGV